MKTKARELGIAEFPYKEFDDKGNVIYRENIDGYWAKYGYDKNGRMVYNEVHDGWFRRRFDVNSNLIYFEDDDDYKIHHII